MTDIRAAAEMALEALEIKALSQKILQPKQEPFAYLNHDNTLTIVGTALREHAPIPLYTAPPSKPWVSLTDDEIDSITLNYSLPYATPSFVIAIEAALRSKNNG